MNKSLRIAFLILGFIFLGIGIIGILLPVLPTTPFFMIASFLLAKGSTRFHEWFLNTAIYQNHVGKWVKDKAISRKDKKRILLFVTILFLVGITVVSTLYIKLFLALILGIHYYFFLFRIKTPDQEKQ